jgi:hypothetical protein
VAVGQVFMVLARQACWTNMRAQVIKEPESRTRMHFDTIAY